jgi:hypothetical protein
VRRAPGRCIVQLGPVALTVSWVHARNDTVLNGRMLVIEWIGTVARGVRHVPERAAVTDPARTARPVNETVFTADAANERAWYWRNEAAPHARYQSLDLADLCVANLRSTLLRAEGR